MDYFKNIEVDNNVFYTNEYLSGDYLHDVYFKKANKDSSNKERFYINIFTNINGELVKQGYLYFYFYPETKSCEFIGIKVAPQFRNLNIGSLLVAIWIDLCRNNGYNYLGTHAKQRKPFLLYLLKTFGFEIFDKSLYDARNDVITIGRSLNYEDKSKLLHFKDVKHEKIFRGTNIFKEDNYLIVPNLEEMICLDKIILPLQGASKSYVQYFLSDGDGSSRVSCVLNRHKR